MTPGILLPLPKWNPTDETESISARIITRDSSKYGRQDEKMERGRDLLSMWYLLKWSREMPLLWNPEHNHNNSSSLRDLIWIHFRYLWAFSNNVVVVVDDDDNNDNNNHFVVYFTTLTITRIIRRRNRMKISWIESFKGFGKKKLCCATDCVQGSTWNNCGKPRKPQQDADTSQI